MLSLRLLVGAIALLAGGCAITREPSPQPSVLAPEGKADGAASGNLRARLLAAQPGPGWGEPRDLTFVGNASGSLQVWDPVELEYVPSEVLPGETCTLTFSTHRVSNELVTGPFASGSTRVTVGFRVNSPRRINADNGYFQLAAVEDDFLSPEFNVSETHEYIDGPRGVYEEVERTRWFDVNERILSMIEVARRPVLFDLIFSTAFTDTLAVGLDESLSHPTILRFTRMDDDDDQVAVVDCTDFVETAAE